MDLNFSQEKMKFPVNILRTLDKRSACESLRTTTQHNIVPFKTFYAERFKKF